MARFANLLGMAGLTSVCSLEHENLRELNLGYVLVIHKLNNRPGNVNPVYKELKGCPLFAACRATVFPACG